MKYKIFAINFGSTSTKIAIFENEKLLFEQTLRHDYEELKIFKNSIDQKEYRLQILLDFLNESNINLNEIDIFVGRGGLIKPVEGGAYLVNEEMIKDLNSLKYGDHVSNLGAIIAQELASKVNKKAYIVDPVVVDELDNISRVSGFNKIERKSVFHALNHRAVARRYAKETNNNYNDLNLIVAHLGGGISVALHKKGKIVDVNNALGGDGPFSPLRAGELPVFDLIDYVYNSKETKEEIKRKLVTEAGIYSYLGIDSGIELFKKVNSGDPNATLYAKAMAYQINKSIGALYYTNRGDIDAVIYTGGLINQETLVKILKDFTPNNVNLIFYPGEDEMQALASGVYLAIIGEEKIKKYE